MAGIELKGFKALKGLLDDVNKPLDNDKDNHFIHIPISNLKPDPRQPRKNFDQESIKELAQSIRTSGVLQPLLVRQVDNHYEIIAGERRWRAATLAGLTEVPALLRNVTDQEVFAIALIENIQRKDLNPLEEAYGIKRLLDDCKLTHEEIAQIIGKSRATVTNLLRLLNLDDSVKQLINDGLIDFGHARSLITLEKNQQIELANDLVRHGMKISVRELENLVRQQSKNQNTNHFQISSVNNGRIQDLQVSLAIKVRAKTSIKFAKNGNSVLSLTFKSLEELEKFIEKI